MTILGEWTLCFEEQNEYSEALTIQQADCWPPLYTRQQKDILKQAEVFRGAVQQEAHFGYAVILQALL